MHLSRRYGDRVAGYQIRAAHESLKVLGANLHFGVGLKGFVGRGGTLTGVETTEGVIDADICVIATHKEPETTIARSMGLKVGSTGALVVNERMETSMSGVYAAGDVVEVPQNLTGIAVMRANGYGPTATVGAGVFARPNSGPLVVSRRL